MLCFCQSGPIDAALQGDTVTSELRDKTEPRGRVIFFPKRSALRKGRPNFSRPQSAGDDSAAIGDLSQFERGTGGDDYARRMIINALAFGFIVMLTIAGLWIAESIALLRKNEDCALSGRRDCADLGLNAQQR